MAIKYGELNIDEKYAKILEPNLYVDSVFADGITFTSKYEEKGGAIYVHKLGTSACEVGTPGRDFSDEASTDNLIQIVMNNNFQKSKKIYGVQANAVEFALGEEQLSTATQEVAQGWTIGGLGCLLNEGTASKNQATALTKTNLKAQVLADRKTIRDAHGKADVILMGTEAYALLLELSGSEFTPISNDTVNASGQMGKWLGFTVIECNGLGETSFEYYDYAGTKQTVTPAAKNYIMYNHEALSIVNNFDVARIIDSEMFNGSKAQVELNAGFRVTNADMVVIH